MSNIGRHALRLQSLRSHFPRHNRHIVDDLPTPLKWTRQSLTDQPTTPQSLPAPKNKLQVPTTSRQLDLNIGHQAKCSGTRFGSSTLTSRSARPSSSKRHSPIDYIHKRAIVNTSERSLVGPEDSPRPSGPPSTLGRL